MTTDKALERVKAAAKKRATAEADFRAALVAAKDAGATFQQIGDALGVTRQWASQMMKQNGGNA